MTYYALNGTTGTGQLGSGQIGSGQAGTVRSAIALAAQKTGINFNYLLGQAKLESGLNATAHAATSSASGLYQFIDQSWLRVVKAHGAEHGLDWAADAIGTSGNKMTVSDPATKRAILDLRNDPTIASMMAAEHASDNKDAIESSLGRAATGTDLYMAHFLGLGGARSFLTAMQGSPNRTGAAMFPAAARANRNVFYASNGQPRTLSDIYSRFADKLDAGAAAPDGNPFGGAQFSAAPAVALASTTLGATGDEVIPGTGDVSTTQAAVWAQTTLDRLNSGTGMNAGGQYQAASLMRPTPATAKLAYMLLATLGA
ncbi:MAG: lytic transglycosylase domain-containing protein [Pseudomonadota bacterium]|nr:lytic transglycosylase domain-containing protein [Pseudomonadota bacterium]